MKKQKFLKILSLATAASLALVFAACNKTIDTSTSSLETTTAETASSTSEDLAESQTETSETQKAVITESDITVNEEIENSADGEHAIEVSGDTSSYSNIRVTKTGDSDSGDEADFYGDNAAVFATDGATLTIENAIVDTDGKHANGVFSYGGGTTVNISDSVINTSGNCSGGLMTTGGGTMNASNLNIHTTGNSSAAIRSDRGGGTVNVTGGSYVTEGRGSPVIYSTADITVSDATLESTVSEGIVVEGKNSVTLNNVNLVANNIEKNSDKSSVYKAVMIYQSMSGDASVGMAEFTMTGGSLTNNNGDIFYVNNTTTTITLENAKFVNLDESGIFLRAEAAGWGSEGKNGGKVNLYLNSQILEGDIAVDEISALNMYIKSGSEFTGAINTDNEGEVYVEIETGSKWILTGDSYITSLTCEPDAIDLNGYTLYVNGIAYNSGASEGEAIVLSSAESSGDHEGNPGEPPSGDKPGDPPDGHGGPGGDGEPPAKPD